MRKLFLLIGLLTCLQINGQELKVVSNIVDSIRLHYNDTNYAALYNLLNSDFKKNFSYTDHHTFYRENILKSMGKLKYAKYLQNKMGSECYLMYFENGNLELSLFVDSKLKIAGLQWLPYKPEKINHLTKKTSYKSDSKKTSPLDLKVDSLVHDYMLGGASCGLSIGIYQNGKIYYKNYGEISRNAGKLPDSSSIFEIGSITKTFTGLLLAKAVKEKKINLNDDIRKFLPKGYENLQYKNKAILVEHLANHTSGLASVPSNISTLSNYDSLNPYQHYSKKHILEYLKTVIPDTFPGAKNNYSNLGMAVLGIILEEVNQQSYAEQIGALTSEMKLTSTAIELSEELKTKLTKGYNYLGDETPYWNLNGFEAAGAIKSNSSDMMKYLLFNLKEGAEYIRLSHELTWGDVNYGIGLGWHVIKTKYAHKLIWHNGGTYGYASFCGFIKEKDCAVIILSNSGINVDAIGIGIFKYLQSN
ncbi:MAG: beta-lactamase family protein [Sphingobacteriaceae bacterium]|nr:beta-lactamase family protein [Sphingobacteriaceae bacterium]